jgi:hypothetical protein
MTKPIGPRDQLVARRKSNERLLIGWREWVELPDLSPVPVKAKIDTGARTSTLHAFALSVHERDGEPWVTFEVHPLQRTQAHSTLVSCPVSGLRRVRSSSGHSEERPVIRTSIRIGGKSFEIDVTLTSRDEMGFRMLLGRAAIRRRFVVDAGRSFLHPVPSTRLEPEPKEHDG